MASIQYKTYPVYLKFSKYGTAVDGVKEKEVKLKRGACVFSKLDKHHKQSSITMGPYLQKSAKLNVRTVWNKLQVFRTVPCTSNMGLTGQFVLHYGRAAKRETSLLHVDALCTAQIDRNIKSTYAPDIPAYKPRRKVGMYVDHTTHAGIIVKDRQPAREVASTSQREVASTSQREVASTSQRKVSSTPQREAQKPMESKMSLLKKLDAIEHAKTERTKNCKKRKPEKWEEVNNGEIIDDDAWDYGYNVKGTIYDDDLIAHNSSDSTSQSSTEGDDDKNAGDSKNPKKLKENGDETKASTSRDKPIKPSEKNRSNRKMEQGGARSVGKANGGGHRSETAKTTVSAPKDQPSTSSKNNRKKEKRPASLAGGKEKGKLKFQGGPKKLAHGSVARGPMKPEEPAQTSKVPMFDKNFRDDYSDMPDDIPAFDSIFDSSFDDSP